MFILQYTVYIFKPTTQRLYFPDTSLYYSTSNVYKNKIIVISVECIFSSSKDHKKRTIYFDVVCMFITYDFKSRIVLAKLFTITNNQ